MRGVVVVPCRRRMIAPARRASPWGLFTAALLAIYIGLALVAPPAIVPDAARGFMVWQSMQRGTAFNVIREPDARDISRDTEWFMTWWTPGQYVVPAALTALHLNLGHAILATVILFTIGGLAGGYVLFTSLGFSPPTAAVSLCIIAAWRYVSLSFRTYTGGEILLFGFAPWAIWLALRCRRLRARDILLLVALTLAGIFLKSAFAICALAILISLGIIGLLERRATPMYFAKLFSCVVLACAVYYVAFGRMGSTPAGLFAESKKGWFGVLFAVSTPLFAATSLSDLVSRIFLYPAAPRVAAAEQLWPLFVVGAVAAIASYAHVLRRAPGIIYRALLSGFLITYVSVFSVLYLLGAAVGTDDRYFRPAAFLVLPGLLRAILTLPSKIARTAALAAILVLSLYGPVSYVTHWRAHRADPVGRLGFSHDEISRQALSRLKALDDGAPAGNSAFYVASPALALELQRARPIAANAIFEDAATLSARAYRGRVGTLVVAVPAALGLQRTDAILSSFRDYPREHWTHDTSGGYVFFAQTAGSR
jgi:hypothetical protein